jgi:hypothetical protein
MPSADFSASQISLHSSGSAPEDWDRSLELELDQGPSSSSAKSTATAEQPHTPRNSVAFPAHGGDEFTPQRSHVYVGDDDEQARDGCRDGKRTLSDLLRMYAQKGTELRCTQDEAARVGQVLGQWVSHCRCLHACSWALGHLKVSTANACTDQFWRVPIRGRGRRRRLFLARRAGRHRSVETFACAKCAGWCPPARAERVRRPTTLAFAHDRKLMSPSHAAQGLVHRARFSPCLILLSPDKFLHLFHALPC